MKTFYSLYIKHKNIEEFEDVFVFFDLEKFIYFMEKFNHNNNWISSYNTNTKNIADYLYILNTDINRQYIHLDEDFFNNVNEIEDYYKKNIHEFPISVSDFFKRVDKKIKEESENEISSEFFNLDDVIENEDDSDDRHSIIFFDNSVKKFSSIKDLQFFLKKIKSKNIENNLYSVKINHKNIEFKDYIETIKIVDEDMKLPEYITDCESLNEFLIAIKDFEEIVEFTESEDNKK